MERLIPIGRLLFAAGILAFGVEQFILGDFVPGRAPAWPAGVPGQVAFAYASGLTLVAIGAALGSGRYLRPAGRSGALLIALWALARHLPLVAADPSFGAEWTQAGKALALTGGMLIAAGSAGSARDRVSVRIGSWCLAAFLVLGGIQHFLFAGFVKTLVPAWVPGPLFWTYFAGVALIAGGVGLLVPLTARLAGALTGLMVFLWVLMLHIPRALEAAPAARRNEWTAVFEATAFSGIALMLSGLARGSDRGRGGTPELTRLR